MQALVLIPVLIAQLVVQLLVALISGGVAAAGEAKRHNELKRRVEEESAPGRARLEAMIATEEEEAGCRVAILAEALGVAAGVPDAKPKKLPRAFKAWSQTDWLTLHADAEAMGWVDGAFDTANAVERFRKWAVVKRLVLNGSRLEVFERAFGPLDASGSKLADRLEEARYELEVNSKIRKLKVPGDFAHPAAKMFVNRVRDVEQIRESIDKTVAERGTPRETVVTSLERSFATVGASAFPQALKAA